MPFYEFEAGIANTMTKYISSNENSTSPIMNYFISLTLFAWGPSECDVYGRHILTYKDDRDTGRIFK